MSLTTSDDELTITRRWFGWPNLALLAIVSFLIFFGLFVSDLHPFEFLFNPLTWFVFGLGYFNLQKVVNKTVVRINQQQLTVKQGPFPPWQNSAIDAADIEQVYIKENVQRGNKSTTTTYGVYLKDKQNHHERLISGLDTEKQAFFFEQEIERYLGLEDRPVSGEHPVRYDFSGWGEFAERNNLEYSPGKLPTGHRVSGQYQGYPVELLAVESRRPFTSHRTRLKLTASEQPSESQDSALPLTLEEVAALFDPPLKEKNFLAGKFKIADQNFIYEEDEVFTNQVGLQIVFDTLHSLMAAYPHLIAFGGEIIPLLESIALDKKHPARPVAAHLIQEIAPTTEHLGQPDQTGLLCLRCLVRCATHQAQATWLTNVTYFGCRHCHQSQEFLSVERIIALLDQQAEEESVQQGKTLFVNWLTRQTIFDFDEVVIIAATDEAVERFAVQVGNDTDPVRQARYQQMSCVIAPDCQLSANTRRILQRTFGPVEIRDDASLRQTAERPAVEPLDIERRSQQQGSAEGE